MEKNNRVYVLTKKAKTDLENIWQYTRDKWSKELADRYTLDLFIEFTRIAKFPYLGKEVYLAKYKLRVHPFQSHLVYYLIDSNQKLSIVRVLHQSMLTKKHLPID